MAELYKRIENLCQKKGISITQMCKECGASRGSLGDLANNRIHSLSANTLQKIASYFEISIDELIGNDKNDLIENNAIPPKTVDEDIRRIQRAKSKMPQKEWNKFMEIALKSFGLYFSSDYVDEDTDE